MLRVSSVEQADPEKDGIPRQIRHIAEHCKKFNLEVVTEFRLEGISGAKVQYNPQFMSMIRRLAEPEIAGVVFSRMDRFFRPEHLDAYEIFKTFRKHKKLLFCDLAADEGLDVSNAQDQMKIQLWGMIAAQERRNIAERNLEGKEASRRRSDRKSDPLPVGVGWDESTGLFYYEKERTARVKRAFKLVLAGSPLSAVVRNIGFSSQTALRKILQNQWWIGHKTHLLKRQYRDETDTVGRKVPLENPVIVPTNLAKTPLVTPLDFERVQLILEAKRKTWTQNKTVGNEFLGPGLLHCACGRKMYLKKGSSYGIGKGNKPDVYICSSKVKRGSGSACLNLPAPHLDRLIVWTATKYFVDEQHIRSAIEASTSEDNKTELQGECDRLEKSIRKIESRRDIAIDLSLDNQEYLPKVKKLTADLQEATTLLARAQAKRAALLTNQDVIAMAGELRERYFDFGTTDAFSQAERKELLQDTVERITFSEDGSLEFVMKGGVLLGQPMSDDDALLVYFESIPDSPKAIAAFPLAKRDLMKSVIRQELAKVKGGVAHPAVERIQTLAKKKGKRVAELKTHRDRDSSRRATSDWPEK